MVSTIRAECTTIPQEDAINETLTFDSSQFWTCVIAKMDSAEGKAVGKGLSLYG